MQKCDFELWDNIYQPVGVVQIVRCADEPANKYKEFAEFLNKNGYMVVCALNNSCENRFDAEHKILRYVYSKYKLPVFLFGCEYGGMIAQQISSSSNLCSGCICLPNGLRYSRWGIWLARIMTLIGTYIYGKNTPARLIPRTLISQPYRYKNLTYCMSYGFYRSLLKNILKSNFNAPPQIPILVIGNRYDINSMNGQLARILYNTYAPYNLSNINMVIYPDVTDELLCDTNWQQAQNDVLEFLNKNTISF